MTDAPGQFVFRQPLDSNFLAEIEGLNHAIRPPFWPKWRRSLAFFGIFVVMAGVLGGLKIASERFLVGFMVGGYLAMVVDGYFTVTRQYATKTNRIIPSLGRERGLEQQSVWFDTGTYRTTYYWINIKNIVVLKHGILLRTGFRNSIPFAFADLPATTNPAEFEALLRCYFDHAHKPAQK